MICPSCGFEQEEASYCRQCSIHIQTHLESLLQEASGIILEPDTVPTGNNAVICPKCGFKQDSLIICAKCGIVFQKYLDEQIKAAESLLSQSEPEPEPTQTGRIESMLDAVGVNPEQWKNVAVKWLRRFLSLVLQLILLVVLTGAAYSGLLYLLRILWRLYLETQVGTVYYQTYPIKAFFISELLGQNLVLTAFSLTLTALGVCLAAGVLIRCLFIARYYFTGRSLLFRVAVWGTICTLLTAYLLLQIHDWPAAVSLALAVVPGFCLFIGSFRLAFHLTPEPDIIRLTQHIRQVKKQRRLRTLLYQSSESGISENRE